MKLLLRLLQLDISQHPKGLQESMEAIRLTVLPLVNWGIRLTED